MTSLSALGAQQDRFEDIELFRQAAAGFYHGSAARKPQRSDSRPPARLPAERGSLA